MGEVPIRSLADLEKGRDQSTVVHATANRPKRFRSDSSVPRFRGSADPAAAGRGPSARETNLDNSSLADQIDVSEDPFAGIDAAKPAMGAATNRSRNTTVVTPAPIDRFYAGTRESAGRPESPSAVDEYEDTAVVSPQQRLPRRNIPTPPVQRPPSPTDSENIEWPATRQQFARSPSANPNASADEAIAAPAPPQRPRHSEESRTESSQNAPTGITQEATNEPVARTEESEEGQSREPLISTTDSPNERLSSIFGNGGGTVYAGFDFLFIQPTLPQASALNVVSPIPPDRSGLSS